MIRNVFILSEVRSGSTYAAELIAYNFNRRHGHELWPLASEPFQLIGEGATPADLHAALAAIPVGPGGLRAGMIKCGQMEALEPIIARDESLRHELLGPRSRWLILRRRDQLAQAVSLHCAMCSGSFHDYTPVPSCVPCSASNLQLHRALWMIARAEEVLRRCEARVSHRLNWCYEDILGNEAGFLERCHRFLLGGSGGFGRAALQRVKLVPAHSQEKLRLRENFADWLAAREPAPVRRQNPRPAKAA